jgi:hypothetical protein
MLIHRGVHTPLPFKLNPPAELKEIPINDHDSLKTTNGALPFIDSLDKPPIEST